MFGMRCEFTAAVAAGLARRGHVPSALFIPGHPNIERPIRVDHPSTILPIAGSRLSVSPTRYPVYSLGHLNTSEPRDLVRSFEPDVLIVACFPKLIPRAIRDIPRLAAINVHPSLLPAHRGPDPLFWIMRDGGAGCGVTLHALTGSFDTGDILAQHAYSYPDGVRESELERLLAETGADLVAALLDVASAGRPRGRPQNESLASYETWPREDDFTISTQQPVRDAWNFLRGVADRGVPVRVRTDHGLILTADALDYGDSGNGPSIAESGQVILQFASGWLLARLWHSESD